MVLFRGLADDLDLQDWLTKYIFPAEAKNVTEDFVRAGTRLGLAEMIRGGTTTYCDMYYFEDAIADETAKAGVRGVLGETVIDFPVADNKTNAEAMAYVERFVKKWQGHDLIVARDSAACSLHGLGRPPKGGARILRSHRMPLSLPTSPRPRGKWTIASRPKGQVPLNISRALDFSTTVSLPRTSSGRRRMSSSS